MAQQIELTNTVKDSQLGQRLDQAIAELFADFSRSRLKEWLLDGKVTVDGNVVTKPRTKVMGGEMITVLAELEDEVRWEAQDIPLDIVYEDDDILVMNKPRDFVVHPGAGTPDGTVLNALLFHCPEVAEVPRAGIVHRLDKDTTGLMVVAKTVPAQTRLVRALQKRHITREYEAIAIGRMTAGGKVDKPIGRHATKRTLMAVSPMGKPAVTHFRVAEHFREHTRIRLRLETGRTHQIRVHMSYLQHPLLGDAAYGGRARIPAGASEDVTAMIRNFDRQALHAVMLRFEHPITGEEMEFHAPVPDDMVELTETLRRDAQEHGLPDEY
ncbi:23S rRNA pseudouridine(1911/1915/1917) synthase RluD [Vibrio vulnificus]|jgi:23S rRNA pseudouridine1911/1915/1917 synthase|uniref:23S rRNA pseudouridine(1911/1915/1917) synthase RluD n=1 Tax=Vibrio vulnificus TaxID=672 RepID=UPI000349FD25|nr:23S rRNA pseudouridine(1911/1915/1917) synthase RluD [Vibrio vulnificus]EWS69379.1 23S rRNA pseudouridylate synthase [Vibrio vulnificus BAA87]AUL94676.1 Ribosomal large subunit pseudouridine synthase D [Vibrio vulnificus]EGQ7696147.1 23S rRNA pseudouridine(1911/1915/1917) synthase RluD [Vibrio vulnificus]EGQ7928999.1 23S rRNA pseudouridine(1911/1915/1917) synthase RluD [Vibrio vulnificus]EGQ7938931.1 23S rRNA pseudouridine(1911/1915/1917) synthase RluD [Vibrio vulnificus]